MLNTHSAKRWHALPCAALVLLVGATANAQNAAPARRYQDFTVSLTQTGEVAVLLTNYGGIAASNNVQGTFALTGTVRIVYRHLLIQPAIGFGILGISNATLARSQVVLNTGIGIGGAIALTDNLALSPMARVSASTLVDTGSFISIVGELPLTIFLGRNGFIEPFVQIGGLILAGGPLFSGNAFLLGGGYRLGVTF